MVATMIVCKPDFDDLSTCLSEAVLRPEVPDDGRERGGGELHALALVAAEEAGLQQPIA